MPELRVGVLAIQGGFEAHVRMLSELGADVQRGQGRRPTWRVWMDW